MGKVCIRCGYERREVELAPDTECPKCGVIYARVETNAASQRQVQQQLALVRARRRHEAFENERSLAGFFTFGWMVTPVLCQVLFVLNLLVLGWIALVNAIDGNGRMVAFAIGAIVASRIVLEGVMVVFRLWGDVAEVRALLTEQAIEAARRGG